MCTKSGAGLAIEAMRLVPQSVGLARLAPSVAQKLDQLADLSISGSRNGLFLPRRKKVPQKNAREGCPGIFCRGSPGPCPCGARRRERREQ
jgi:hypothetical protein